MIKSLTKHDNCCNYCQYLHSTLSAFSQGTVLSQLPMLFFNEFDSFNIRTTFASVLHSSSLKTTGETNICSKSSQTCQDTSKCEQLQDTRWHQLTSIVFPSRYLPVGTLTSKKNITVAAKFRPSLPSSSSTHGFSRASPKEQHERYSTGKKRNEHSGFLKHDTTQFLHPRALAQMQFQIVSNPVCINIILYLYIIYTYEKILICTLALHTPASPWPDSHDLTLRTGTRWYSLYFFIGNQVDILIKISIYCTHQPVKESPLILSYLQCLLHDNGEAGSVQCFFQLAETWAARSRGKCSRAPNFAHCLKQVWDS